MRRDLEPIELPPAEPDYGGTPIDEEPEDVAERRGTQPIDDLDAGVDPEHLGAPGQGMKVEDEPDRPGIDERGPVQEPRAIDDPEMDKRSKLAKTIDPAGENPDASIDPNATEPRGWQEPGR